MESWSASPLYWLRSISRVTPNGVSSAGSFGRDEEWFAGVEEEVFGLSLDTWRSVKEYRQSTGRTYVLSYSADFSKSVFYYHFSVHHHPMSWKSAQIGYRPASDGALK